MTFKAGNDTIGVERKQDLGTERTETLVVIKERSRKEIKIPQLTHKLLTSMGNVC